MQKVTTFLWFDNQAAEAAKYYCSIFKDSKIVNDSGMVVTFEIDGQRFMALNGGPRFQFSEAISLFVWCKDQKEIDTLWKKLVRGGSEQACGWLKDKYGLSWQIIPRDLPKLIRNPAAMQAMLGMKKIDLKALKAAADGAKATRKKRAKRSKRK